MKRLLLMRHAKSDYPPGVGDHDRPLNRRGRLTATLMGAYLREEGAVPDLAYVSSAARAQETWRGLLLDVPAETRPTLFLASAETILDVVHEGPADARSLMLVCHQPGVQDAANQFLGAHLVHQFPTAQIVAIDFETDTWDRIAFGDGALIDVAAPKNLV